MNRDTGIGMIGIMSRGVTVNTVTMGRGATEITMIGLTNRGVTHESTTRPKSTLTLVESRPPPVCEGAVVARCTNLDPVPHILPYSNPYAFRLLINANKTGLVPYFDRVFVLGTHFRSQLRCRVPRLRSSGRNIGNACLERAWRPLVTNSRSALISSSSSSMNSRLLPRQLQRLQ
jgi:hypothetical protein